MKRFSVVLCSLGVCLLLPLHTVAEAIAIYDAFAQVSVSAPGPIPTGTGISLFTGSTLTPVPIEIGTGVAVNAASAAPPGTASATAFGNASAPPDSFAASLASAASMGALLNENAGPVNFPLTVSHSWSLLALVTGPNEAAASHFRFEVLFDGAALTAVEDSCFVLSGACVQSDAGSTPFTLLLTPGFHSLLITANADGFAAAAAPAPVPEPSTLVLLSTTVAGLGMARWRARRRSTRQE